MQIFDQEVERHRSPLAVGPISARRNTAAAIGRARAEIHCGGVDATGPHRDWIRWQNCRGESAPDRLFLNGGIVIERSRSSFAQAGIGDWSREPGQCPLSVQVFMTLMQKAHRLTDN
ncbi:hypothetical protein [Bradyrhizobium sp. CCBAU 53421]|uniref:hypothetical protein n=1 Tax=Bradyrhizobium sp. CCBAU 53421 TaxID=1325120 RepID=UPI00188B6FA8|nr:hypothetical protein [Bradyrhizobium sp. CCBAU 53421]